jgi:SAM-dependent methyltransferase
VLLSCADAFTAGRRVVEVAPMRCTERLFRQAPGVDYTSFDLERHAMEQGDITAMRYADRSVDAFVCFHVLEHLPQEADALREIYRVLRPGAVAVVQVPVDPSLATTVEYGRPDPRDVGHVRRNGRDFPDRLRRAGFHVAGVTASELAPPEQIRLHGLSHEPIYLLRRPLEDVSVVPTGSR